jgi:two-component system, NarL family, nitrate/nitrite response regulator NarL
MHLSPLKIVPHRLSVVVVDDHPIVLYGVSALLDSQPDLSVVAICTNGLAAVEAIERFQPDVALIDFSMPEMSGLDVLSHFVVGPCPTKFIFLTATASDDHVLTAIARGARGIILKGAALDNLIQCVRNVGLGRFWFPEDLVESALSRQTNHPLNLGSVYRDLTSRERQVVTLVSQGLSNKEIANTLNLTEGTIKIHLHNIFEKLGIRNRTELTAVAIAHRNELSHDKIWYKSSHEEP